MRNLGPEAPEVVTGFFFGGGRGGGVDLIMCRVEFGSEATNHSAFAGRINAFERDDGGEPAFSGDPGESTETILQFRNLLAVIFFL